MIDKSSFDERLCSITDLVNITLYKTNCQAQNMHLIIFYYSIFIHILNLSRRRHISLTPTAQVLYVN